MSIEPTDRELLGSLGTDPVAFEVFYRRHVDRVVGFAARRLREPADVADLVAGTFVAVLTSARSYDPARGEPTAWLLGISARLIAGESRRRERESAKVQRFAARELMDPSDLERLEERIDASRSSVAVIEALEQLKPRHRETLLLVGVDGSTPAQAARLLGITAPAFRMRLTAARRALAKALRTQTYAAPLAAGIPSDVTPTMREVIP
jgi:RNA polymerase sigma factor (sigma-70 family)